MSEPYIQHISSHKLRKQLQNIHLNTMRKEVERGTTRAHTNRYSATSRWYSICVCLCTCAPYMLLLFFFLSLCVVCPTRLSLCLSTCCNGRAEYKPSVRHKESPSSTKQTHRAGSRQHHPKRQKMRTCLCACLACASFQSQTARRLTWYVCTVCLINKRSQRVALHSGRTACTLQHAHAQTYIPRTP